MKALAFLLIVINFQAFADQKSPDWFCVDESGKRDDNVIWSCGVGEAPSESLARADALREAFNEFKAICAYSSDCSLNNIITEPKRLSCIHSADRWKCYRLISVTILEN